MISSQHPYVSPSQRRWGAVSWWFSLVLIVPFLGIAFTFVWTQFLAGSSLEGRVIDAYTGEGVADAQVQAGDRDTRTSDDGAFTIRNTDSSLVTVSRDGYDSAEYELPADDSDVSNPESIEIALRPTTMTGQVTERVEEAPLGGVVIDAVFDGEVVASTESDADGSFVLTDIPEGAEIRFTYQDYAEVVEPIDDRTEMTVSMRPGVLSGTVLTADGEPIVDASVGIHDALTFTGEDGTFRLENIPEDGELMFKAPGYHALGRVLDDQMNIEVTLDEKRVRAIYVTAGAVGNEEKFNELLDLAERTEISAMVIDIKDSTGQIFYDSQVELANEIGAVNPQYDVEEMIRELNEREIYTIARQVIFEDPKLAAARNDLAIANSQGGLWQTWNGITWLNAYEEEIWDYNIEIMLEAVELGFDEVQFDYMRFPSDGPLDQADYGVEEHNSETRVAAIAGFLQRAHEAIIPTRAYLGGDIFGLTLWELGDGGIGQNLEAMTPHLDYIKPMIYPSHFYPGSMGFDIPNDHPYEVILYSLQNAAERIPGQVDKLRPWLQDFSYGEGKEYGPDEVRDQIRASEEFGATGWMLWSASNNYQEGALEPANDE
ncbi:MAG: putative glycoside hydrolase [Thermomicrobiaceae bacterium]